MTQKKRTPSTYQRNALAPSLLAAAVLFLAPVLLASDWASVILYVTSILAVIVGWFAVQARHWWWIPVHRHRRPVESRHALPVRRTGLDRNPARGSSRLPGSGKPYQVPPTLMSALIAQLIDRPEGARR